MTRIPIQIRWGDVDGLGHVYNGYYQHYFDLGKSDFFRKVLNLGGNLNDHGVGILTAATKTNYYAQIFPDDQIEVVTSIESLGNKSITIFQQVLGLGDGAVKSDSLSTMVCYKQAVAQSVSIPERWRAAMASETAE